MTNPRQPAKRGPGRPRKNPLPPPAVEKIVEAPATEPEPSSDLDWPQLIYEVVVEYDAPASPADVAAITDFEIARATELLDNLVTDGRLVLGDDGLYRLPDEPGADHDIIGPPISDEDSDAAGAKSLVTKIHLDGEVIATTETTIEGEFDDTLKNNVVYLPSSDIVAFLKHINLPPQLLAGFGVTSKVNGFLAFESSTPTAEDPRPVRKFRVVLYGEHMNTQPLLNPNQPGYQDQQRAGAPDDAISRDLG